MTRTSTHNSQREADSLIAPQPLRQHKVDRLVVNSYATREEMGSAAAADIAAAMRTRLQAQAQLRMIFAAAPSQSEALAALITAPGIDWGRVTAFHMDEYIGLPADSDARFARWLDRHLFSKVGFAAVHRLQPDQDPQHEAQRYAALLNEAPIDFVCMGVGENGHIAFNDPPVADFADPEDVKRVELELACREQQVHDGCFPSLDAVPTHALTLTIPRLLRAERLFCIVPGPTKRAAVAAMLNGPISTSCPASILRTQPACSLFLDRESSGAVGSPRGGA